MAYSSMHDILDFGVSQGASDWHIREGSTVALRIDGRLVEMEFVVTYEFISKAMDELCPPDLLKQYAKSGDADFAFDEEDVGRFRANLHCQRGRMSLTLRHVKGEVPSLDKLHLPEGILRIADSHRGIVFVTGTTGSGKSTTLACMLEYMNSTKNLHIVTIEDPIEYTFQDRNCVIEQREVGIDVETFHSALVHVLRQDPDVIVVGEMRDRTTFETAVAAAETGHLVLTTLHTLNASQSVLRILDLYPIEERESIRKSLASSLRAIICQRLVPKATGKGVVPAIEILLNTPIVAKLLSENRLNKLANAIAAGVEDGMMSFNHCLLKLVNEGMITEEAAMAASDNRESLQMNLRGIFLSDDGGLIGND